MLIVFKKIKTTKTIVCLLVVTSLFGCGGGGGGGGDVDTKDGALRQSINTAIRVLHGSLDATPVDLYFGTEQRSLIQTARFGEQKFYQQIDSGERAFSLERANSPGNIVVSGAQRFSENTEYTVFIYGSAGDNNLEVRILEDITSQAGDGVAFIRLANAVESASSISATVGVTNVPAAEFGNYSAAVEIPAGIQTITVSNAAGASIATLTTEIPNRGEVTVLVAGDLREGFVVAKPFLDLD